MEQLLVTIDSNQPLQNIRKAISMLRGVISTQVVRGHAPSATQSQQAYVKDSLTRALMEVKDAEARGERLQSVDDFLKELDAE